MHYYDVYISVGIACRPAYHLKLNNLRDEAGKIKNILCAKGYNKMYFVNDCYALEKDFL